MKAVIAMAVVAFLSAYAVDAQAQHMQCAGMKGDAKGKAGCSTMGKPSFAQSVDGYKFQAWVMTQEMHNAMMEGEMTCEGMAHGTGEMKDSAMSGTMDATHHIMLSITDEVTGKTAKNAGAVLDVQSPSTKSVSTKLMAMSGHLCGGVSMAEKGTYQLKFHAVIGSKPYDANFTYLVE